VLSSGSFEGIHDKLLDAIGDAIRPAHRADFEPIKAMLTSIGLVEPARDEQMSNFFTLRNESGVIGLVALEVHGDDAILHSLAVDAEFRGGGYGWMLADVAVSQARWRGVRRIYLLTETASDFFAAKFGFRVVDRSTLSKAVANSETFMHIGDPERGKSGQLIAMRLDL
jgi:N-acetylglutamate synthase-like GNAT family acetyltransferase